MKTDFNLLTWSHGVMLVGICVVCLAITAGNDVAVWIGGFGDCEFGALILCVVLSGLCADLSLRIKPHTVVTLGRERTHGSGHFASAPDCVRNSVVFSVPALRRRRHAPF